jgi:hypothetical protein
VVREVRLSGALAERLRAPVTARGPWLTAVLNHLAARRSIVRPVAVVVDDVPGDVPAAAAFLTVRPGPRSVIRLLTAAVGPLPGGRPPARLLAQDLPSAEALADGIVALVAARRGPWRLELTGLPLGDPTLRALAARLPMAGLANERTIRLVDELVGAERTTDPREVDRLLAPLLPTLPRSITPPGYPGFLRAVARLHASLGALEVATAPSGGGLVTLLDGSDRWPWWGSAPTGLRTEMGAPLVRLTASGRSGRRDVAGISARAAAR